MTRRLRSLMLRDDRSCDFGGTCFVARPFSFWYILLMEILLSQRRTRLGRGQAQEKTIHRVVKVLRDGGICAVPTDTVYGLIADAANERAVAKIFDIKGRPKEKAVSLFVRDIRMAKKYAEISPAQERFLEKIWPGKVTVVLRSFKETIGLRVPKDELLQKVLKEMGAPLAQTSANISGKPPARNVNEILLYFQATKHGPNLIVDGGARDGEPSTVLDLSGREPKVLREGAVSRETVSRWYTYF